MTARYYGVSACALAVLLLGISVFGGRAVLGAEQAKSPAAASTMPPRVMAAWVRLPAVGGRPAGGYFTIHGNGRADALVGVASPAAQRVEMHSMVRDNGVMRMRAEAAFQVPARGELLFAPGGSHLMLFGLKPGLKAGDRIPLTFTFESGAKVTLEAEARAVTAAPPAAAAAGGHQH